MVIRLTLTYLRDMPSVVRAPHPALAGYVDDYVGYDHVLHPDAVHHGLPSGTATVIIAFEEPLDTGWIGTSHRSTHWTLAGGLHTRAALIRTHGRQCGIQIGLTPAGARALLGLPIGALANVVVHHGDLTGGIPSDLHAKLAAAPSWEARFRLLDAHLLAQSHRFERSFVAAEVSEAWRVILASRGTTRVEAVARHVGWSRRHLESRFRAEVGFSPKQSARIVRFDRARRLAESGHALADVATAAGYSDQAHLTREWRGFAGQTPRETLAENLAFLQDEDPGNP